MGTLVESLSIHRIGLVLVGLGEIVLLTTLVVLVKQSVQCVFVCVRALTFELSDLWRRYIIFGTTLYVAYVGRD